MTTETETQEELPRLPTAYLGCKCICHRRRSTSHRDSCCHPGEVTGDTIGKCKLMSELHYETDGCENWERVGNYVKRPPREPV